MTELPVLQCKDCKFADLENRWCSFDEVRIKPPGLCVFGHKKTGIADFSRSTYRKTERR